MTDEIEVLCISRTTAEERSRVAAIDARIRVTDAGGWFNDEVRETWPKATADRFMRPGATGQGTRAERDALLASADVILIGFPFPLDLRARARKVRWVHQRPAGASNLLPGDIWGSDITVTTSRGAAAPLPIAEYVVGSFLHFARGFHRAELDRKAHAFDKAAYAPIHMAGKTACVIGAGGIGREVGRLAAALGMTVVGTRRDTAAPMPEGFTEIYPPEALMDLLPRSDFVVVCCQWTPETEGLIGTSALAAMKADTVLVNVARGEIVDEAALVAALDAGRLRGVALDVYVGEFEGPPDRRLWDHPKVLITPHVSNGSDVGGVNMSMDVFCRNLEAFVAGRPLENVIDWARGY